MQQVPYEAALAVIECKSIIDQAAIKDANSKFDAINALKRKKAKVKRGKSRGPIYILFGYTSKTTDKKLLQFAERSRETYTVCLGKGITLWLSDQDHPIFIPCLPATEDPEAPTLTWFYAILLSELNSIDLGRIEIFKIILPYHED